MISPAKPADEAQRLKTMQMLNLVTNKQEERFDRIARVLAALLDVPVAMVNLITGDLQINKACFGVPAGSTSSRDSSFCGHTILSDKPMIIENALDDVRFRDNPNVTGGLKVRAYAGIPLRAYDGTRPGALCAIDIKPRKFSDKELQLLTDLAAWAEIEMNSSQLRQALDQAKKAEDKLKQQLEEVKHLNDLMVGRELKMVELKEQLRGQSS